MSAEAIREVPPPEPAAPPAPKHTGLICLSALARAQGMEAAAEHIAHQHALTGDEPDARHLVRIARKEGFKARSLKLDWDGLAALEARLFPVLARLKNGRWILLPRPLREVAAPEIMVGDPLSDPPMPMMVDRAKFEDRWDGTVVVARRGTVELGTGDRISLSWFLRELAGHKRSLVDVAVATLTLHVLGLAVPIFFQIVIDKVIVHRTEATLLVLLAGVGIALLFEGVFVYLRQYLLAWLSRRVDLTLALRAFGHLLSLPITFFERASAGVLVQHMQQSERIREFMTGRLLLTCIDATVLLVVLPLIWMYSPILLAVVATFAVLIAATIMVLIGPFRRRVRALYEAEGRRQAQLVETIHGMQTIKSLAMEPGQRLGWEDRAAETAQRHFHVSRIGGAAHALVSFLEKAMTVAVVTTGVMLVFGHEISIGALIAVNMLAGRVTGPLAQMAGLVQAYQEVALSVRMLGTILESAPEPHVRAGGLRPELRGHIALEDVRFSYPGASTPALQDVSVEIPASTIFGIVGTSGSGKTTLVRLIQGLYPMQDGILRIDSQDIRRIDLGHMRRQIGVVLQESFLFRGTVRDNIGCGRPDASFEQIVEAARLAGADEFIERLPQGFDTPLEENATNLSGGQRQRLAIARALIRDPRILILDEATSALDPESEAIFQDNLRAMARGRTIVIVTHRLSNLVTADRILVLSRGRVSGLGTHRDLLASSPIYRRLWQQQTRHMS